LPLATLAAGEAAGVGQARSRTRLAVERIVPSSVAGMLTALRVVLIAAQFLPSRLVEPTHEEILAVQHAWATAAA
jgi:hypothetical protein